MDTLPLRPPPVLVSEMEERPDVVVKNGDEPMHYVPLSLIHI